MEPPRDVAVDAFAAIARKYCEWAESGPHEDSRIVLIQAQHLLAELHLAVLHLPSPQIIDNDGDSPNNDKWAEVHSRFMKLPLDGYWDVFNPLKEEAPVFNSLADDISDIYRDLVGGLFYYDQGVLSEAVWEWRFNFYIHWGAHLTGAQRAIHAYMEEYGDHI